MAKPFDRNLRQKLSPQFKQHILKMVLARLDFSQIFAVENVAAKCQSQFAAEFPEPTTETEVGYDIDMSNVSDPKLLMREQKNVFCLSNSEGKKKAKLSSTAIILEHHKYSSFNEFFDEFSRIAQFIFASEIVFQPKRLGLRKVNSIVLEELDGVETFEGYFSDQLLAYLQVAFLNPTLTVDRHFLNFFLPEDRVNVNFQFSSEKGKLEGKSSRRFVLDIDVYTSLLPVNMASCLAELQRINEILFDIFWASIGPKTEKYLMGEST